MILLYINKKLIINISYNLKFNYSKFQKIKLIFYKKKKKNYNFIDIIPYYLLLHHDHDQHDHHHVYDQHDLLHQVYLSLRLRETIITIQLQQEQQQQLPKV